MVVLNHWRVPSAGFCYHHAASSTSSRDETVSTVAVIHSPTVTRSMSKPLTRAVIKPRPVMIPLSLAIDMTPIDPISRMNIRCWACHWVLAAVQDSTGPNQSSESRYSSVRSPDRLLRVSRLGRMRYLITGGAGFIGANYIRSLLVREPETRVINLDRLTYSAARATIEELEESPRHVFVQGDVRDEALVRSLVDGADVVINFAAESHVDRSIADPLLFTDTNVGGTTVLLRAASQAGVERFVHVSTDEVYGPILTGAAGERALLRPTSPYAAAKAGADLMVGAFAATFAYRAIIARPCNNVGPYQFPEKLIPRFVTRLLQGRSVPLYGDGQHQRDWLSVDDTCAAIDLLVRSGTPGDIYNISAGNLMTNEQLAHRIVDLLGEDRSLIERVADRPGHDRRYATDSTKLRALGWEPTASFDQALADTVAWYGRRFDWWKPFLEILD